MKRLTIILILVLLPVFLFGEEIRKRPFSPTPTWEYKDDKGNKIIIRQQPFSSTPTYEWSDLHGNRGKIIQRPFSPTPTYDIHKDNWYAPYQNDGVIRKRPYSTQPAFEFKDYNGNLDIIRSRPYGNPLDWDVKEIK